MGYHYLVGDTILGYHFFWKHPFVCFFGDFLRIRSHGIYHHQYGHLEKICLELLPGIKI